MRVVGSGDREPSPEKSESPPEYVQRLASIKARHALRNNANDIILGADTSVVLDGEIFGKPADADVAVRVLRLLRGRPHEVITGIALIDGITGAEHTSARVSKVFMREYSDEEIFAYVSSGEPFDKAGAYAVQDERFRPSERVEGCYLNTVGLPLCDVLAMLEDMGAATTFRQGWDIPPGCPDCESWNRITNPVEEVSPK